MSYGSASNSYLHFIRFYFFFFFSFFFLSQLVLGAASEMIFLQKYGVHHLGVSVCLSSPSLLRSLAEPFYLFPALPFQMFALNTLDEAEHPARKLL